MRILVMQTTRMGDVLQTSPLVRRIRRKHPDAHITLMVRDMGKTVAGRNSDVDEVLVYNEDDMFIEMRAQDSDQFLRAYRDAEAQIQRLKDGRFDLAYNCTHSIASAMLLKLAEIPNVIGAHLSDDWSFVIRGPWVNYFFTSVFHREYNDLNLCDITQRFVDDAPLCQQLVLDVTDADRAFVDDLYRAHRVADDDFVACFQLGASEASKRWSETHFATLGRLLREKRNARIFLVGVKDEEPLGSLFEAQAPGIAVPLFGKTTIPQLAALLERAALLVSNDTGTMHIAAAVNCRVVLVSVGYVHFRETGPYGVGHCAIERHRERVGRADNVPGGLDERMQMRPDQVFRAVDLTLGAEPPRPVPLHDVTPELADVDIFMTRFAPDGCLEWYPVLLRPMTETDFLRIAYRAMWLEHLAGQSDAAVEQTSIETMLKRYDSPADDAISSWTRDLADIFRQLAAKAQYGIDTTTRLVECLRRSGGVRMAQPLVQDLVQLDEDMRIFGELHASCKPLVLISRYERDSLEGADPVRLAQTTLRIYRNLEARASLTAQKITHVAELAGALWTTLTHS